MQYRQSRRGLGNGRFSAACGRRNFLRNRFARSDRTAKNILGAKENEKLIAADIFNSERAEHIDTSLPSLLIVSGVFQYFREEKIVRFLSDVKKRFPKGELIFDAMNEIGIKYANKYVQKTGNTSAQMYFYVNDGRAFAQKCGTELVEQRTFYTAARKMLKRKLKLYTRIAMKVHDDGGRTIILHTA